MIGYSSENFKGLKVLVTGAAGFIGSNLVEALCKLGCSVRALDDYSTGKKENIDNLRKDLFFEFVEGSICDFDTCLKACKDIEIVLHQAAWGSVPRSIRMPLHYEIVNVGGTLNMLEAAKQNGVKRFVYASSSSVYGDSNKLPKKEGEEGFPLSPYAVTKHANEVYAKLYNNLYKLQTIGLRYFNVFGKRQDPFSPYSAVIPLFIKTLLAGEAPVIYGNGNQGRDFTYIDNVVHANILAIHADEAACGEVFNIGCGHEITVNYLFTTIQNNLCTAITPQYKESRAGDTSHSLADISKAKAKLGYSPLFTFNEGILRTIDWYKNTL